MLDAAKHIYNLLVEGVTAKVYPMIAPASAASDTNPYVVYNTLIATPQSTKQGQPLLKHSMQVDVYGDTYKEVAELADTIYQYVNDRKVNNAGDCVFSCRLTNKKDGYNSEDETYRCTLEFDVITNN
jgi:hypothetical protein